MIRRARKTRMLPPIAALAIAVFAAGCEEATELEPAELATRAPSSETFREAVDAVLPAVVHIQARIERRETQPALRMPIPPGPGPGTGPGPGGPRIGAGSGVIFSENGYILTSNHVVRDADRLTVILHDRRQFRAEIVGRDPSTDVAILKIDAEGLPVATFGRSEALRTGDWVLAVGSPLGLLFTVTSGIVSAKGRYIGIIGTGTGDSLEAAPVEHFIQTDAAINPGNSGGPLINLGGQVIGINTAIVSPTGVFAGIGFAIPIDLAREVARDLIEYGEVRRPYLGVVLEAVTAADAEIYELAAAVGAEVVAVQPESPASGAGLRLGDVIVGIGGAEVKNVSDLQAELTALEPGETAVLQVVRFGERLDVPVELGIVRSGSTPEPAPRDVSREPARLGFAVTEAADGVAVAYVSVASAADRAGVRQGQRVITVNGQRVRSIREFAAAVGGIDGDIVSLVVLDPTLGRTIINYRLR